MEFEDVYLYADIGVERTLAAEKGAEKIAVEVKVFGSVSNFSELQKAAGQYQMSSIYLQEIEPERKVFLAISQEIYKEFFQRPSVKFFVNKIRIRMLVFDGEKEEIVQWIN